MKTIFKKSKKTGFTRTLSLKRNTSLLMNALFPLFNKRRKQEANLVSGFTIIELLVVISIIALLATVIISTVSSSRSKARDANIATEIHLIKVALEEYNTGHGGFPNPQGANQSPDNMYCIGSTECVFNGVNVNTELKGPDIALKNPSYSNLASSFPTFQSNELAFLDDNNKGYIYVACGGSTDTCPADGSILLYPKVQQNAYAVINVGTFEEVSCEISQCQENYGHNCGNGTEACSDFSNSTGACNYDANGTGSESGSCICGDNGTSNCSNYCGDSMNNNGCSYDSNGTGTCNCNTLQYSESSYPYCTSDSNAGGYSYDSGSNGWCSNSGYNYYGTSAPSNYPYYNGTGNCISVNVSGSYGNGQSGSYCDNAYNPGYTESSYPWFTSDGTAGSYGYSYGNGWSGYGYYGTSYPGGYANPSGSGSCIYISVSGTYGNGYYTANYCTSQNATYGCTNSSACNYNGSATADDGSCEYTSCNTMTYGCTDSTACNYNSNATSNDGSCEYTSCQQSYSCQGTPNCNYYDSSSCGSYPYCSWSSSTSNYCAGSTYSVYHYCSDFDYYSCPSNGTCSPYSDEYSQYCSGGSYYDYGNCSDISYESCNSYSGCYQSSMETGGSCSPNISCSNYSDQYSCGNVNGCSWTY